MSCFYFCFFLLIFVFKVLGFPRLKKSGTCKHAASRCLKSFSDVLTGVLIAISVPRME